LPVLPSYSEYLTGAHVDAANPAVRSVPDLTRWLSSAWGWELVMWAAAGVISLPFVVRELLVGKRTMAAVPVALYVAAVVGVVGLGEFRFVNAFEPAVACAVAIAVSRAPGLLANGVGWRTAGGIAVAGGLAFVLWLSIVGVKRSVIAHDWYSVVSNDVLDGMEWIRLERAEPGTVVVAGPAPRGNIYGWWIEGLARLPTYSAGSAELFVDPRERRQVETATRLLDLRTPLQEARSIVQAEGVRYVFLDKGFDSQSRTAVLRLGFITGYENSQIAVLKRIVPGR
ncbi:MAG: hypothetical protein HY682_02260, partial [Chloroflexi bacterium]|nr:hypothetical protein [Chloroflexota bacterium]